MIFLNHRVQNSKRTIVFLGYYHQKTKIDILS